MAKRICSVERCDRQHYGRGLCNMHWMRWRKHGDPGYVAPPRVRESQPCQIQKCSRPRYVRGWCVMHYQRWRAHGDPNVLLRSVNRKADHYHDGYHFIHADGRIVQEHRHVMEQHFGRALLPGETVHHRNGHRADNRRENLELWVTRQPKGQRAVDLLAWAEEIVARYGPERDLL